MALKKILKPQEAFVLDSGEVIVNGGKYNMTLIKLTKEQFEQQRQNPSKGKPDEKLHTDSK